MKIIKEETLTHNERGFSIKLLEWDVSDYLFNIKAFGKDFSWRIYKGNPTPVEMLEWESVGDDEVIKEPKLK
jgi:hypothetical protein